MSFTRSPSVTPLSFDSRSSYFGGGPMVYDSSDPPTPRPDLTRHWSSLQEHANAAHRATTPFRRMESRREGFTWEAAETPPDLREEEEDDDEKPRGIVYDEQDELSSPNTTDPIRQSIFKRPSAETLSIEIPTRKETTRSSVSSIARGLGRGVPDLRTYGAQDRKDRQGEQSDHGSGMQRIGTVARRMSVKLPTFKTNHSTSTKPKLMTVPKAPVTVNPAIAAKESLKERRGLNELPRRLELNLPLTAIQDLPARSRSPLTSRNVQITTPAHPCSPRAPLVKDRPLSKPAPKTRASDAILESPATSQITRPIHEESPPLGPKNTPLLSPKPVRPGHLQSLSSRSLVRRARAGQSETSTKSPNESRSLNEEASQLSTPSPEIASQRATRHWRRPFSSSEIFPEIPSVNQSKQERPPQRKSSFFSFNPLKPNRRKSTCKSQIEKLEHPEASQQLKPTTADLPRRLSTHRQYSFVQSSAKSQSTRVELSLPPVVPHFEPPEKSRVPTPPLLDAEGEVKGKLADFFFDVQQERSGAAANRSRSNQAPKAVRGIWDSDALLMSQTELNSEGSDSEYSPGLASVTGSAYFESAVPKTQRYDSSWPVLHSYKSLDADGDWFRVRMRERSRDAVEGEERETVEDQLFRERFEWVVPEHLPSSPLCPLHPKYRGGGKGFCLHHGIAKSSAEMTSLEEMNEAVFGKFG